MRFSENSLSTYVMIFLIKIAGNVLDTEFTSFFAAHKIIIISEQVNKQKSYFN